MKAFKWVIIAVALLFIYAFWSIPVPRLLREPIAGRDSRELIQELGYPIHHESDDTHYWAYSALTIRLPLVLRMLKIRDGVGLGEQQYTIVEADQFWLILGFLRLPVSYEEYEIPSEP